MLRTSDETDKLTEALATAQGEMESLSLNAVNPHFKSKYANLAETREKSKFPLSRNGLTIMQAPSFQDGRVCVTTRLAHKSGQWMESTLSVKPTQDTPQAIGSAITYAKRYGMQAMLGLVGDEDDDGNAASQQPTDYRAGNQQGAKKQSTNVIIFNETNENQVKILDGMMKKNNIPLQVSQVAKHLNGQPFNKDAIADAVQKAKREDIRAEHPDIDPEKIF